MSGNLLSSSTRSLALIWATSQYTLIHIGLSLLFCYFLFGYRSYTNKDASERNGSRSKFHLYMWRCKIACPLFVALFDVPMAIVGYWDFIVSQQNQPPVTGNSYYNSICDVAYQFSAVGYGLSKFCIYYFLYLRAELVADPSSHQRTVNLSKPGDSQFVQWMTFIKYQLYPITFEKFVLNSTFGMIPVTLTMCSFLGSDKSFGFCSPVIPIELAVVIMISDFGLSLSYLLLFVKRMSVARSGYLSLQPKAIRRQVNGGADQDPMSTPHSTRVGVITVQVAPAPSNEAPSKSGAKPAWDNLPPRKEKFLQPHSLTLNSVHPIKTRNETESLVELINKREALPSEVSPPSSFMFVPPDSPPDHHFSSDDTLTNVISPPSPPNTLNCTQLINVAISPTSISAASAVSTPFLSPADSALISPKHTASHNQPVSSSTPQPLPFPSSSPSPVPVPSNSHSMAIEPLNPNPNPVVNHDLYMGLMLRHVALTFVCVVSTAVCLCVLVVGQVELWLVELRITDTPAMDILISGTAIAFVTSRAKNKRDTRKTDNNRN